MQDEQLERVRRWLAERIATDPGRLGVSVMSNGKSNLTYLLTVDDLPRWVLRRPPLAGVVQSAHDVLREFRIMAALSPTALPLPGMVGSCADLDVIGAPFLVMDFVPGVVLSDQHVAETELAHDARAVVGEAMISSLARLHGLDPDAVGLADLGRGVRYVERQLQRWAGQLDRLAVAESPVMADVLRRLQADIPEQREVVLLHGDYRPGNTIVGPDGELRAILDWELSSLGDPLADLGWLLVYWGPSRAGEEPLPLSVPTRAAGFAPRDELARRYAELTGRSLVDVQYYMAFALWRLAAILAGVQARTAAGGYGDERRAEADAVGERVAVLARAAGDAATKAGR